MQDLIKGVKALGSWCYQIMSIKIPAINVSFWVLFLTLFALSIILKATDVLTHGYRGMTNYNNNNKVYKDNE